MSETVEVFATFVRQTDQAILINDGTREQSVWIPKSVTSCALDNWNELEEGVTYGFDIELWIAEREGLV